MAEVTSWGGGEEFILEGDEYDSAYWDKAAKFFHYQPDDLIITSLEFDHADIYADFDAYQLAFRRLVNLVPRRGSAIIWGDSEAGEALHQVTEKAFCPVVRYGFEKGNDWIASSVKPDGDGMAFTLTHGGQHYSDFKAFGKWTSQCSECDGSSHCGAWPENSG